MTVSRGLLDGPIYLDYNNMVSTVDDDDPVVALGAHQGAVWLSGQLQLCGGDR